MTTAACLSVAIVGGIVALIVVVYGRRISGRGRSYRLALAFVLYAGLFLLLFGAANGIDWRKALELAKEVP